MFVLANHLQDCNKTKQKPFARQEANEKLSAAAMLETGAYAGLCVYGDLLLFS
jgi:hypothetical protein